MATNTWFVGTATGVISGLLVYFLSRKFLERDDQKLVREQTIAANREVLASLRIFISEQRVPHRSVIKALLSATARKYQLDPARMLSPEGIAEDLIKEVMDSNFINSEAKDNYCQLLADLSTSEVPESRSRTPLRENSKVSRIEEIASGSLAAASAIAAAAAFFLSRPPKVALAHAVLTPGSQAAVIVGITVSFAGVLMAMASLRERHRTNPARRKISRELDKAVNYASHYGLGRRHRN